jgi:hypothetical protein
MAMAMAIAMRHRGHTRAIVKCPCPLDAYNQNGRMTAHSGGLPLLASLISRVVSFWIAPGAVRSAVAWHNKQQDAEFGCCLLFGRLRCQSPSYGR